MLNEELKWGGELQKKLLVQELPTAEGIEFSVEPKEGLIPLCLRWGSLLKSSSITMTFFIMEIILMQ